MTGYSYHISHNRVAPGPALPCPRPPQAAPAHSRTRSPEAQLPASRPRLAAGRGWRGRLRLQRKAQGLPLLGNALHCGRAAEAARAHDRLPARATQERARRADEAFSSERGPVASKAGQRLRASPQPSGRRGVRAGRLIGARATGRLGPRGRRGRGRGRRARAAARFQASAMHAHATLLPVLPYGGFPGLQGSRGLERQQRASEAVAGVQGGSIKPSEAAAPSKAAAGVRGSGRSPRQQQRAPRARKPQRLQRVWRPRKAQ